MWIFATILATLLTVGSVRFSTVGEHFKRVTCQHTRPPALPVIFLTNSTMESNVRLVWLKRATAFVLWKSSMLGTAMVPKRAFKLREEQQRVISDSNIHVLQTPRNILGFCQTEDRFWSDFANTRFTSLTHFLTASVRKTVPAVLEIPTGPPVRGRQLWRRTGNFLLIFFNFIFMIWDSSHEDLQLFWLSFKHWVPVGFRVSVYDE